MREEKWLCENLNNFSFSVFHFSVALCFILHCLDDTGISNDHCLECQSSHLQSTSSWTWWNSFMSMFDNHSALSRIRFHRYHISSCLLEYVRQSTMDSIVVSTKRKYIWSSGFPNDGSFSGKEIFVLEQILLEVKNDFDRTEII